MYKNLFYLFVAGLLITSCGDGTTSEKADASDKKAETTVDDDALFEKATNFFKPLPDIAENPDNPLTPEKIALGKKLYFDNNLSKEKHISCNSCHNIDTYGVDNKPVSEGDDGGFGDRNSPTVLNAAIQFAQFWDGRNKDVEEQAGGPILNPVEMAIPDTLFLLDRLSGMDEYQEAFLQAFPGEENPFTYTNVRHAIAAYERTLMTHDRFDQYLKGDKDALTDVEKKGLETFINTGCIQCHIGPGLGGNMYQKFGVYGNYWEMTGSEHVDEGRYKVTGNETDKYMFKVPLLRNIEKTYPYFHDGSVAELDDAVRIMAKLQLNKDLTDEEVNNIVAFLKTLTGTLPEGAN